MRFDHRRLTFAISVLLIVATACSGPRVRQGGEVTAFLTEPHSLDPTRCFTTDCSEVLQRVFDSLLSYDPETAELTTTGAATRYEISEDAKTFTFTLRQGATFHNGEPVNAEAFIRSLSQTARKETASEVASQLSGIVGFDAAQKGDADTLEGVRQGENEYELVIELTESQPEFIMRTGHTVFSPIPQAALDDPDSFREEPIGNGPYRMAAPWQHNERIRVTQWEDYNGGEPGYVETITWRIFEGADAAYIAFEDGDLDVTEVPREQLADARDKHGEALRTGTNAELLFMFANTEVSPTDDANLRRAISRAINRDDIIRSVLGGQNTAATSILPPATPGHRPNVCEHCVFDREEARRLLQEAGGAPTERLTLTYFGDGGHGGWTAAVQSQVRDVLGIDLRLRPVTPGPQYGALVTGEAPRWGAGFGVQSWVQDYPTPQNWLYDLFHSEADGSLARYSNSDFDALVERARGTIDEDDRLRLYRQAEDMVLADMPVIPMWYPTTGVVHNAERFSQFVVDVQTSIPAWERVSLR